MNAICHIEREPEPIEIDPRPCELCGLTIDRHDMVDDGEGPQFYCPDLSPDEMTLDELERRAELIRQEEVAAIFAQLEAMDDPSKRLPPPSEFRARSDQPAASTVAAFWYVVGLDDLDHLRAWLDDHPRDKPALFKLLESK
jgi:hypothetical protein